MTESSNPQQTSAFARLPNELLLAILEQIDRPLISLTDEERAERRETLGAACLVSKRLYKVAQPVLWRQMEIKPAKWGNLDGALKLAMGSMRAAPAAAQAVRALSITGTGFWTELALDEEIAALVPNVEEIELRCTREMRVDFDGLARFPKLRRLDTDMITPRLRKTVCFPQLTTLSFRRTSVPFYLDGAESLFSTTSLPSLRHLSLRGCTIIRMDRELGEEVFETHFPELPRDLVDQLEDIQMDVADRHSLEDAHFPSYGDAAPPPLLFHSSIIGPNVHEDLRIGHPPVHHLQFSPLDADFNPRLRPALASVVANRVRDLPHLRLVLLPTTLWKLDDAGEFVPDHALDATVLTWWLCGVHVRTYDPARTLDGLVVPEFKEFLREQAAGGEHRDALLGV